jgi:signal peptidase I
MNSETAKNVAQELQLLHAPRTDVMFHGLSMEPLLQEGDRVILEPVSFDEIQIGDIITYRYQDKYPTRRVVARKHGDLVLWCDNWPRLRFRAAAADVLGRVIARTRRGERLHHHSEQWQLQTGQSLRAYRRSRWRSRLRNVRLRWARYFSKTTLRQCRTNEK